MTSNGKVVMMKYSTHDNDIYSPQGVCKKIKRDRGTFGPGARKTCFPALIRGCNYNFLDVEEALASTIGIA